MGQYSQLSKEQLIQLLEERDYDKDLPKSTAKENIVYQETLSQILLLLFDNAPDCIEKSLELLLPLSETDPQYAAMREEFLNKANATDKKRTQFPAKPNPTSQTQDYLSVLNTRFRLFFENLPIGAELYDSDGYLIEANDADLQIFGSDREGLVGIRIFDNPHGTEQIFQNVREDKGFDMYFPYEFTKVNQHQYYTSQLTQGTKYLYAKCISLIDKQIGKIGYMVTVTDNTEKQIQAEIMSRNLTTLKAILLNGHSLIGAYDISQDLFSVDPSLNDHLENNFFFEYLRHNNLTFSELQKIIRFENPLFKENNPWIELKEGKKNNCTFVCQTDFENESLWVRFNLQAYGMDDNGLPAKIIFYIQDISEEKLLEEKLRQSKDEIRRSELEIHKAQEADKLKSAFLANMSHEIRTPLNAIVGFSSILVDADNEEEKKIYVNLINKNNDLLLHLITDILDFSKMESGTLEYCLTAVHIKDIFYEQKKVHSLKLPPNLKLICDLKGLSDPVVYTDYKRVTQVLSNLISNAIKFTPQGSITLSCEKKKDDLFIEVTDTGIGIPSDKLHTIFNRFVKIDTFRQGAGLGLTISKMIVEALNGKIGVDSTPGKGSKFWFTLPLRQQLPEKQHVTKENFSI